MVPTLQLGFVPRSGKVPTEVLAHSKGSAWITT